MIQKTVCSIIGKIVQFLGKTASVVDRYFRGLAGTVIYNFSQVTVTIGKKITEKYGVVEYDWLRQVPEASNNRTVPRTTNNEFSVLYTQASSLKQDK